MLARCRRRGWVCSAEPEGVALNTDWSSVLPSRSRITGATSRKAIAEPGMGSSPARLTSPRSMRSFSASLNSFAVACVPMLAARLCNVIALPSLPWRSNAASSLRLICSRSIGTALSMAFTVALCSSLDPGQPDSLPGGETKRLSAEMRTMLPVRGAGRATGAIRPRLKPSACARASDCRCRPGEESGAASSLREPRAPARS